MSSGPALAPAFVRAAIRPLAVSVVVVAVPAGAKGRLDLEDHFHHLEGILDQRVAGLADAVANQLQKPGIDDLPGEGSTKPRVLVRARLEPALPHAGHRSPALITSTRSIRRGRARPGAGCPAFRPGFWRSHGSAGLGARRRRA